MYGLRMAQGFAALGFLLILFILLPLASLTVGTSPREVIKYGFDSEALSALYIGISASLLATVILMALGIPLAYVLAKREFRGRELIKALIDLPLIIPHGVAGIALLVAYNSRTMIGSLLTNLGLKLEDSFWGIVAVMAFVSAPLMVDSLIDGFLGVDVNLEYVARSLGASESTTFWKVTMPLASRSLITGSLLSWARGMSEVGALLIVAYYPKSINVLIMERFWTYGLKVAKATALPLLVISLVSFVAIRRFSRRV